MTQDTDAEIFKAFHDHTKRCRAVTDPLLREELVVGIDRIEKLYSRRLTEAHDEAILRRETEAKFKKIDGLDFKVGY